MKKILDIHTNEQKDFECLPQALFSVFNYYQLNISLDEIIETISHKDSTKLHDWFYEAGILGLKHGLMATIKSMTSYLFDPSWTRLDQPDLKEKLKLEADYLIELEKLIQQEPDQKICLYYNKAWVKNYKNGALKAVEFLNEGGIIDQSPISKEYFVKCINDDKPVIFNHYPAILHNIERAYDCKPNDVKGFQWGHVAIVIGYNDKNQFYISDPSGMYYKKSNEYWIDADLLIESILRYNGEILFFNKKYKELLSTYF
ncbi:C39 family peptidase [Patescibacteria group bacterium]|nr:C39 family peptidase [Patescibacteria group bacterium]